MALVYPPNVELLLWLWNVTHIKLRIMGQHTFKIELTTELVHKNTREIIFCWIELNGYGLRIQLF